MSSTARTGLPALILPATGIATPSDKVNPVISMPLDLDGFIFIAPFLSSALRCPLAAGHRKPKCSPISLTVGG